MMGLASETFTQVIDRIFDQNESIVYMVVVDDQIEVVAQKGFLELHPSKMEKLYIQATLLVKMCSLWTEDFGRMYFAGAEFADKYEILVIPLSKRLQAVVVLSHATEQNLRSLKESIANQFKSLH